VALASSMASRGVVIPRLYSAAHLAMIQRPCWVRALPGSEINAVEPPLNAAEQTSPFEVVKSGSEQGVCSLWLCAGDS